MRITMQGIKYIGEGEFVVTEDRLKELLETEVATKVASYLGFYDSSDYYCMVDEVLNELYPTLGSYPYCVADSLVAELKENR